MTLIYFLIGALIAAGLMIWRERSKEKHRRTFYIKSDYVKRDKDDYNDDLGAFV